MKIFSWSHYLVYIILHKYHLIIQYNFPQKVMGRIGRSHYPQIHKAHLFIIYFYQFLMEKVRKIYILIFLLVLIEESFITNPGKYNLLRQPILVDVILGMTLPYLGTCGSFQRFMYQLRIHQITKGQFLP